MSKHPGSQPSPEISHCDCAGVNCTQKKAWCVEAPLDGGLESSEGDFRFASFPMQNPEALMSWILVIVVSRIPIRTQQKELDAFIVPTTARFVTAIEVTVATFLIFDAFRCQSGIQST